MKIWLDIRNLSSEQKRFSQILVQTLAKKCEEHVLNVYSQTHIDDVRLILDKKFSWFLGEQFLFAKRILEDKNDLIITFNDNFPVVYKKRFIQVVTSLEKLLYPSMEFSGTIKKHTYQNILKTNLKNAQTIICFDEKTKKDINEKLNIDESKIQVVPWFFYGYENQKNDLWISIDIKQKHSLSGEYMIYDSETGSNKNIKRLLESLAKTQAHLIFIGNKISSDIEVRELVMQLGIKEKVIFAGIPDSKEMPYYYEQSSGVIFPILYGSFPLSLNRALHFGTQIYCSSIDELQNILWNKAEYFSPISTLEITQTIEHAIKKKKQNINYDDILKKYTQEKFIDNLVSLCQI